MIFRKFYHLMFISLKDFLCKANYLNYDLKIIDLHNPERVNREPDQIEILFSSGDFEEQGILVKHVELRLFIEKNDEKLGPFSLITSFVETNKGSVEMIYDEGYRGEDSLNRTVKFLVSNMGLSALILRSIIALKSNISN